MTSVSPPGQGRSLPSYDISGLNVLILEKQKLMRSLMQQVFQTFKVTALHITGHLEKCPSLQSLDRLWPDMKPLCDGFMVNSCPNGLITR